MFKTSQVLSSLSSSVRLLLFLCLVSFLTVTENWLYLCDSNAAIINLYISNASEPEVKDWPKVLVWSPKSVKGSDGYFKSIISTSGESILVAKLRVDWEKPECTTLGKLGSISS